MESASGWIWRQRKWIVLAVSSLLTAGLGYTLATGYVGDSPASSSSAEQPNALLGGDAEEFFHDVGEVISGEVVTHSFLVCNDWEEVIEIRKPTDIVIHCGCSSMNPVTRQLAPGESTEIKVTLRTLGREGTFANGGEVIWTAAGGKQRKLRLTLRAEVRPALQVSDEILVFDDGVEPSAVTKEITFTATKVPIDWDSLHVSIASPFQLAKVEKSKDRVRCVVTHPREDEREEVTGRLQAEARLRGTKSGEVEIVSVTVGVIWRPRQDLVVTPKIVPLVSDEQGRGKARLHLRGKKVEQNPNSIRSVACEGYSVDWKLLPVAGGKAAILELSFAPTSGVKASEKPLLSLNFQESKPVQLPVATMARKTVATR